LEDFLKMEKEQVYKAELDKLNEIFQDVDESKKKLVDGLIQDAAFLYAENYNIKRRLNKSGMIKFHPKDPSLQKTLPAAKEYRQNLNSYSVVIKTLNGVLQKANIDEDDDMEDYE
jgi:regulator of replication initiation timing